MATGTAPQTVALFEQRNFFEKALRHGVRYGILSQERLDAMHTEGPKGMVQIARYFGSEYLRPELEKARARMVNLISLHLEQHSEGDLGAAAALLRDHSLQSRSKAGSDMLRALLAMPRNTHFGMHERSSFDEDAAAQLAPWTLRSLADYRAELAQRTQVAAVIDAALWLGERLGMDADALADSGCDAEAVIRTALLAGAARQTQMPDWVGFQKMVAALRKKGSTTQTLAIPLPPALPAACRTAVLALQASVVADVPRILDATVPARKLFDQTPAFIGRYFWTEDALAEVDHFDRETSAAWHKATAGHSDDSSLLTLFLCIAAGSSPKTLLTAKAAAALVRKVRKTPLQPGLARQYILAHAPAQHQSDYLDLWNAFVDEAQATLHSDRDYAMHDALALLQRDCNVA